MGSGIPHSSHTSIRKALPEISEKYQTHGVANQSARWPRSITISPRPKASTRQMIPSQSARPLPLSRCKYDGSFTKVETIKAAAIPIGTLMQKFQRQFQLSVI